MPQSWDGRPWEGPPEKGKGRVPGKRFCKEKFPSPVIVGEPPPWDGPPHREWEQGLRELPVGRETPLTSVNDRWSDRAAQCSGDKIVEHRALDPGLPGQGDHCLEHATGLLA